MTYGWALVVIVIVIAALIAFNVLTPPTPTTCTGMSTDFGAYIEHKLTSSGTFSLVVVPAKTVTITQITLGGLTLTDLNPTSLTRGTKTTIIGSGGPNGTAGQTYTGKALTITYNTANLNGLNVSGTCSGVFTS